MKVKVGDKFKLGNKPWEKREQGKIVVLSSIDNKKIIFENWGNENYPDVFIDHPSAYIKVCKECEKEDCPSFEKIDVHNL